MWESSVFVLPVTADTWSFFDYLDSLNTNILPWWWMSRDSLSQLFSWENSSYQKIVFLSDASELADINNIKNKNNYFVWIWTEGGAVVRYANGNILRSKWKNIYTSFDSNVALSISRQLNAKMFLIENIENVDTIVSEIIWDKILFSFAQFSILLVLLALCVLLLL